MAAPVRQTPTATILVGLIFALLTFTVALSPKAGEPVAIIDNPFAPPSALGVVSRADGQLIEVALSGRIVIAHSDTPHFVARLYRSGAFLVFNPRVIAGCQRS